MLALEIALADMARSGYDISGVQKPKPAPGPAEPKTGRTKTTDKPAGKWKYIRLILDLNVVSSGILMWM